MSTSKIPGAWSDEWPTDPPSAREIQRSLAGRVILSGNADGARHIAGVDASYTRDGRGRAAAVLLSYPDLTVAESTVCEGPATFPYVPGLLSFREIPLVQEALAGLAHRPDLIVVDGQGIAHPRRFGLACHLGVLTGIPTVGCAKSRLIGDWTDLPDIAGHAVPLLDHAEQVGWVLRSKIGCKPLFVSPGHLLSMEAALAWVLRLLAGHRLPEPTRQADILASSRRSPRPKRNHHGREIVDDTDTR